MSATNNFWKLGCVFLLICCATLAYRLFDVGISHTYEKASCDAQAESAKQLRDILFFDWSRLDEQQVKEKIRAYSSSNSAESIFEKQDAHSKSVTAGQIQFEFIDGKLVNIR